MHAVTLVDIGANLTNKQFARDLALVLARAHEAHVAEIIVTGTSVEGSIAAAKLVTEHARAPVKLASTAGIHPHNASTSGPLAMKSLRELAPSVVAIGECGLDFNRNFSPKPDQLVCFEAQLELAAELGKPVFLHERDAAKDFGEILGKHRGSIVGGVVHCFTGDREALARYLDLDLYVGITGWICDERRGKHLHDLVKTIPRERLLVETDAPYLYPRDLGARGGSTRNEPSFLPHVARTIAKARDESYESLAAQTTANAQRLFGLAE